MGFSAKHDSGTVRVWGWYDNYLTDWTVFGGPVVGFQFKGYYKNMSIIVGDKCMPKYFKARKLSVILNEKRLVQFFWQKSYS